MSEEIKKQKRTKTPGKYLMSSANYRKYNKAIQKYMESKNAILVTDYGSSEYKLITILGDFEIYFPGDWRESFRCHVSFSDYFALYGKCKFPKLEEGHYEDIVCLEMESVFERIDEITEDILSPIHGGKGWA